MPPLLRDLHDAIENGSAFAIDRQAALQDAASFAGPAGGASSSPSVVEGALVPHDPNFGRFHLVRRPCADAVLKEPARKRGPERGRAWG